MRNIHCTIRIVTAFAALTLSAQTDWPAYGRDPGGQRYSPLKQINTKNVTQLQVAWTYDTQAQVTQSAAPGRAGRGPRPRRSSTTPLVINGVMYLSTAYNRVVALEAESGKKIWEYESTHTPGMRGISFWPGSKARAGARPEPPIVQEPAAGRSRGSKASVARASSLEARAGARSEPPIVQEPAAGRSRGSKASVARASALEDLPPQVIFGTNDGFLIALNAHTGRPVPGFGTEGLLNLREGVADKFPNAQYGLSSPPAIYKDLIITGSHTQEAPSFGPSGDIRAWDVKTGKLAWRFHTLDPSAWQPDQAADRSGLNSWGFITVDATRGILYVPMGTPTTDFYGGDRKGSNLYGSSLVALDANTGKLKWHFQTTHHDNWDYDLEAAPLLFDAKRGGKTIPAVAEITKQGLLFAWDRVTGAPLWGVEERPVISDNPFPGGGDEPWPTQPFPLKPGPLSRNTFNPEEVSKVTPEHEAFCRNLLGLEGGAMTGGPYAQYGPKLRIIFPAWIGGGNWGGMSFDPQSGYLFVNTQSAANLNKIIKSPEGRFLRVGPDGQTLGEGNLFWDPDKNWPCQQPPWGEMSAIDTKTGNIAWRVPLGSFEELDAKGVPKTGTPNMGGSIATAGGLVFIGATVDSKFHALDAKTGKELWTAKMDADAQSTPMSFQGKDGRQYVAIMASGSVHYIRPPATGKLYVFALPQ